MTSNADNYLIYDRGPLSWLFTLDHKRIGVMYLAVIGGALVFGGLLALLMLTEIVAQRPVILEPGAYGRVATLHGALMLFMVAGPAIPAVLGLFLLPILLHRRNLASGHLALLGFWAWLIGSLMVLMSLFAGGPDTGMTFSLPYALQPDRAGVGWLAGGVIVLAASIAIHAVNFLATIRLAGSDVLARHRIPIFVWSMLLTSIVQLLAAVAVVLVLGWFLYCQGRVAAGEEVAGPDPAQFQQMLWFALYPFLYVLLLPVVGIVSEIITVHSRRPLASYSGIIWASIAIAVLSLLSWGSRTITGDQSPALSVAFSAIAFLGCIPVLVIVFNWLATLRGGSIALTTPMIFALAAILHLTIATVAGLFLAAPATAVYLQGTFFMVAQQHYLLAGTVMASLLGGLFHWWPKIAGRMYREGPGRLGAGIMFVGFNLTFLPLLLLGAGGVSGPSPEAGDYSGSYATLVHISSAGATLLVLGFATAAGVLALAMIRGADATANPWRARSLEWQCNSPPTVFNFDKPPVLAADCYDFTSPPVGDGSSGGCESSASQNRSDAR